MNVFSLPYGFFGYCLCFFIPGFLRDSDKCLCLTEGNTLILANEDCANTANLEGQNIQAPTVASGGFCSYSQDKAGGEGTRWEEPLFLSCAGGGSSPLLLFTAFPKMPKPLSLLAASYGEDTPPAPDSLTGVGSLVGALDRLPHPQ